MNGFVHDKPLDYHYRLYRTFSTHINLDVYFVVCFVYFLPENLLHAIFRRAKLAFVQGHTNI